MDEITARIILGLTLVIMLVIIIDAHIKGIL